MDIDIKILRAPYCLNACVFYSVVESSFVLADKHYISELIFFRNATKSLLFGIPLHRDYFFFSSASTEYVFVYADQVLLCDWVDEEHRHYINLCKLETRDIVKFSKVFKINLTAPPWRWIWGVSYVINFLRPGDAIWWHRSLSTFSQVMAYCLTAPSPYLNQGWFLINGVLKDSFIWKKFHRKWWGVWKLFL